MESFRSSSISPKCTSHLGIGLVYCAPVYLLTWYFGLFESLVLRVLMSLLVAMVPTSELFSQPRPLKSRGDDLWFALFIVPASLLATGQRFNVSELVSNSAVGIAVFPWAWLVWQACLRPCNVRCQGRREVGPVGRSKSVPPEVIGQRKCPRQLFRSKVMPVSGPCRGD